MNDHCGLNVVGDCSTDDALKALKSFRVPASWRAGYVPVGAVAVPAVLNLPIDCIGKLGDCHDDRQCAGVNCHGVRMCLSRVSGNSAERR